MQTPRILPCIALCLCGLVCTGQEQKNTGAPPGLALPDGYRLPMNFPTGGYWPWERLPGAAQRAGVEDKWQYAESLLRELKTKHNWNTVWVLNIGPEDAKRFLRLAEEVGVWVLLEVGFVTHHFYWISHASPEALRSTAKKTVEAFGGFKALAGYVFTDEPSIVNAGYLENMRREVKALDPERVCLTVTMIRDTGAAAHRTGLPVLVTDVYPFGYPRSPNLPNRPAASRGYYRVACEYFGELSARAGRRPWMMPQIFQAIWGLWYYDENQNVVAEAGAYLHWRMPSVGETRWQIWCALANHSKGVLFYVLFPPHHPRKKGEPQKRVAKPQDNWPKTAKDLHTGNSRAMLFPDGAPTPQMSASSEVFGFIRQHAALLDRLTPLRPGIAYAAPPCFASSFQDPDTGDVYAMVYTDETEKPSTATVSFLAPLESGRDVRSGTALAVESGADGLSQVRVSLGPGDGTLLALKPKTPELPRSVAVEDFTLVGVGARLDNAKRVVRVKPYGLGWRHCVVSKPDQPDPPASGTVTCTLAGTGAASKRARLSTYPKDAAVYVAYEGQLARADQESLILQTSKDGKAFAWTATGLPAAPVQIPRDAKAFRFEIKPGAWLSRFELIAVPAATAK